MLDELNQLIKLCKKADELVSDGFYPAGLAKTLSIAIGKGLSRKDGEDRWVTTEEGNKVHLNENGVADTEGQNMRQILRDGRTIFYL